jgi:hypothetical protein
MDGIRTMLMRRAFTGLSCSIVQIAVGKYS